MPIPCNLRIPECPGSSEKEGREDTCDVFEIEHGLHSPHMTATGQPTGSRIHSPLRVVKQVDKATPLLLSALCMNKVFKEVTLDYYRIDPDGRQEVKYYTVTLKKARISEMRPYVPNTLVQANERLHHMEMVSMVYEEIEWQWLPDSIVAADRWSEPGFTPDPSE